MAEASFSSIRPYLPGALAEWSHRGELALPLPAVEYFDGAFLVVDVSGFTRIASRLSRQGGTGVERISEILTDFFTKLVADIETEGGIVFGFEGDALLAAWRRDVDPLPIPLLRCCGCALLIKERFKEWRADGQALQMRMSIGAGRIELMHLGDDARRCYLLATGEAVAQATALLPRTDADEILISSEAWPLVQESCGADSHEDGTIRLVKIHVDQPPRCAPKNTPNAPLRDLSNYLPRALRAALSSSLPDWVGELRIVTIGFFKISFGQTAWSSTDINRVVLAAEQKIDDHGGEVLEIANNAHELELLCVFGLPSETRENIGQRAILAAMEISAELGLEKLNVSTGIATGRVFCGPVGPKHRRQYSVVGAPVYLASRISSVAAGRILIDEATVTRASRSFRFDGPWPLHLAGIRDSVNGFVPLGAADTPERLSSQQFINRDREIGALQRLLQQTASGSTEVMLIDGEPGIGKTALVSFFAEKCVQAGVEIWEGACDALDQVTPYLVWRGIILQCLKLDASARKASEVIATVKQALSKDKDLGNLAPLLNDVLDLRLPENLLTSNMVRDVRAENLKRLLLAIITKWLSRQQNLVILEDIQWADESSARLLVQLIQSSSRALIIATCRHAHDAQPLVQMFSDKAISYRRLSLQRLSKKHAVDLACKRLNRKQVSDWFGQLIMDTTDGNPLFVDEICHVINQEKTSAPAGDDPIERNEAAKLPKALETAVLSRIDHLPMDDQLTAKLASVIGLTFRVDLLKTMAPKNLDVDSSIRRMLTHQLFKASSGAVGELAFRHQIIRDLVYASLLTKQRRESHTALARLFEADSSSADSVRLPLILHHWRSADDPQKMVMYLDQVAALRLRQFDNTTAIKLLNECLALSREHGIELDNEKRAVCHLLLGEAYIGSGRMAGARKSYEIGLSLLGQALPKSAAGLMTSLFWQGLGQCLRRLIGETFAETPASTSKRKGSWQRFHMAAQAYEDLTRIYYLAGEKIRMLHATLKATNLAEGLHECTPALAINYATLGAICGVIPLRRQAEHYLSRASELGELYNEPNVSSIVHLTKGLYRTSIADWAQAKAHFVAGLEVTRAAGDKRRWCELAVSLETICGPWLLTPAFSDLQAWSSLLDEMYQIGRDREDFHVLGWAVLGSLRGNRILGKISQTKKWFKEIEELLQHQASELELIHRVEGCAHLASMEFAQGNTGAGDEWLRRCNELLADLNPGMKVRTLAALSFLFDACLERRALTRSGKDEFRELEFASRTLSKLKRFARIYPVGQPEKLRCEGDLCAMAGRIEKAVKLWRGSLERAVRLKIAMTAFQAAARLDRSGYGRISDQLMPEDKWPDNLRTIAERATRADEASNRLTTVISRERQPA
jgi:class 3 adenylate cyclase/tetratricopeptide (TPR) repeat protein